MFPLLYFMSCFPKLSNLPIPSFQKKNELQSEVFDVEPGSPQAFIKDTYLGSKAILIDVEPPQTSNPEQMSTVESLAQQLLQQGFEVDIIQGQDATSEKIASEFNTLMTSDFELYRKFVYISGPVYQRKFIVPIDGQVQNNVEEDPEEEQELSEDNPWGAETSESESSSSKSLLSIQEMLRQVQQAKNLFLVIEADVASKTTQFPKKDRLQHHQLLINENSSTAMISQQPSKGDCENTSAFICALQSALSGQADYVKDGIITSDEISVYLEEKGINIRHAHKGNVFFPNPLANKATDLPPSPHDIHRISQEDRVISSLELLFELQELKKEQQFTQEMGDFDQDLQNTQRQIDAYYRSLYDITSRGSEALQQAKPIQNFYLEYMDHLQENNSFADLRTHQTPVSALNFTPEPGSIATTLLTGDQSGLTIAWNIQSSSIISKYNFEREISVLQKHPTKGIALVATKAGSAYLWNYKKNTIKKLNTSKGSIIAGTKMVDDNQIYWIVGNDQGVVMTFAENGRQLNQINCGSRLYSLHADQGVVVAGSDNNTIHIFDLDEDGLKKSSTLQTYYSKVEKLELIEEENRLVSYSINPDSTKGKMQYWDLKREREKESFSVYNFTDFVVHAEEEKVVIATAKGEVDITDLDGDRKRDFESDPDGVSGLAFSDDASRIILVSSDGKLYAHSGNSGRSKWTFRKHAVPSKSDVRADKKMYKIAMSGDYIVTIGPNSEMFFYSLAKKYYKGVLANQELYRTESTKNIVVGATAQGAVYVWDAEGKPKDYVIHNYAITSSQTSLKSIQENWKKNPYPKPVYLRDIDISNDDSKLAIAFEDKMLRVWDLENGDLTHLLSGHSNWPTDIEFSGNGELLASSDKDGNILIFGMNTGSPIYDFTSKDEIPISTIAFSSDSSKLAAGDEEGNVLIVDVISGEKTFEMKIEDGTAINKVQFDRTNDKLLIGTSGGQFIVLDNKQLKTIDVEKVTSSPIEDILVYPRNNQIIIKSEYDAHVYDMYEQKVIETFDFDGRRIADLTLSEMGSKALLTSGEDWRVVTLSPYSEKDPWLTIPTVAINGQLRTPKGSLMELDAEFGQQFPYRMCFVDHSVVKISEDQRKDIPDAFIPLSLAQDFCE